MDEDPLSYTEIESESLSFSSPDGLTLHVQTWQPLDAPLAHVILLHSLGEYSGYYHDVATYLYQEDYSCYIPDLRGHGHSTGQRGHVEQFQDYLQDIKILITYLQEEVAAAPIFLIGHSIGGVIALMYALAHQQDIAAVVASSPALQMQMQIPGWRILLANLMARFAPKFTLHNHLNPKLLSHQAHITKTYRNDPLMHNHFTARWAVEYMKAATWLMDEARQLAVPVLILQGGSDKVTDPAASRTFFDRLGLEDKYYIEYETMYHDLLHEVDATSVLGDIESWLIPRLQPEVGVSLIA